MNEFLRYNGKQSLTEEGMMAYFKLITLTSPTVICIHYCNWRNSNIDESNLLKTTPKYNSNWQKGFAPFFASDHWA